MCIYTYASMNGVHDATVHVLILDICEFLVREAPIPFNTYHDKPADQLFNDPC